jgi:hypothetical protein
MDTGKLRYGPVNRPLFYCVLIVHVLLLAGVLWQGWRAMEHANPWVTGAGFAAAAVYVAAVLINNRSVLRQGPWKFARRAKPVLRFVK